MQAHHRRTIPPDRTLELFSTSPPSLPRWEHLPARTRQVVTSLLVRVLIDRARRPSPESGSDVDER